MDSFQETSYAVLEAFWFVYHESAASKNESDRVPYSYQNARAGDVDLENHHFIMRITPAKVQAFTQKITKFKLPKMNPGTRLAGLNTVKDIINYHILVLNCYLSSIPIVRNSVLSKI